MDVSGRPDKTLTLASGQTLAGIGRINGNLLVATGATLSPAGTNTTLGITVGANPTGTISATNAIILHGTTVIKLNGPGVNDSIQAGSSITYGGNLNLVNISGAPLAAGNSFQIFNAASHAGSFAGLAPATPGIGLAWDTTQLSSGRLNVVAAPAQPVVSGFLVSGSELILSGSNGVGGAGYYVLGSTNATIPLADWAVLATNTFDANGVFRFTNAIIPGATQRFYCIQLH